MVQGKLKKILTDRRVIVLLVAVVVAFVFINPNPWRQGLEIRSVDEGSPADAIGIDSREKIISVNAKRVNTVRDFRELASGLEANSTVVVETDQKFYRMNVSRGGYLGIEVAKVSKSNLKTGLDLQGGTRVLLRPEDPLSPEDMELLIANMNRRLNVFGLSDITVRDASDIGGQQYIMVEVASVNEAEIRDLISRQGKFEAKIGNESAFLGTDVLNVCRSADCSGIDVLGGGCRSVSPREWVCPFYFSISLSQDAAQRQAAITRGIPVANGYLSERLFLYLDDELVDELSIAEGLKGQPAVSIQISGSGSGITQNAASKEAIKQMKHLQTILITGSLPVKLSVAQTDSVSPVLGEDFVRNALVAGASAIVAVMLLLLVVYRRLVIAVPIILTSLLELFLLLGVAAIIGWNIDMAAIAGIIAAVGTGVNDQIIITDEAFKGELRRLRSWKEKLKSAFSVIMGAYFTLLFAMIPLFFIGAGLLRGFAVTTVIGITVGVLITRPAYARIIEILSEDKRDR